MAADTRRPMAHDAFISYSHAADQALARELEHALERFAKPWYRRRALDIFRDEGNLNLSSHLQGSLFEALDRSRFLIHLASPAAAASPWVGRELTHWLAVPERRDRLILVVTSGRLVWDDDRGDFDRTASTAVSPALHGVFSGTPFYLDLSWAADAAAGLRDDTRFRTAVVAMVATIRRQSAEDLAGEDAEQHRRTLRIRNAAIGALAALSLAALGGAWLATIRAREATEQRGIAEREARAAREALARSSLEAANRAAASDRPGAALAYLAQAVRADPDSPAADFIAEVVFNEPLWLPGPPLAHAAPVIAAAVMPDGERVVTASVDGTARLWNLMTGAPLGLSMAHAGPITSVAVSPNGQLVATTSSDRTARLWNAATGAPVGPPLAHTWRVRVAVFSPDGDRLVTTTHGHAHVWDTATGREVVAPLDHGTGEALDAAAFSPDGRLIVTGAADYTVRGWDAATGAAEGQVRHRSDVVGVEFDRDGRRIVTASLDGTARIWDIATGTPVGPALTHQGFLASARFSADGRAVVTASSDGTARIWDAASQTPIGAVLRHDGGVNAARFSVDGSRVVTASADRTARVWDANTGAPIGRPLEHAEQVHDAMFTTDGRVITVSADATARVWTLTGVPSGLTTLAHDETVGAAEFSRDGSRVVAAGDHRAHLWDATTGRRLLVTGRTGGSLLRAHLSPDGRILATEARGEVQLWDAASGTAMGPPHSGVHEAAFSADGRYAVLTSDTSVKLIDLRSGQPVPPPVSLPPRVEAAAFLPDGTLALLTRDARLDWDLGRGTATTTALAVPAAASELGGWQLSPSGRFLVTNDGGDVQLRDATTGAAFGSSLRHVFAAPAVVFSPDERRVGTTSGQTARIWELPSGRPVTLGLVHADSVESLSFRADGRRIVTASRDGSARTWDADTGVAPGARLRHRPFRLRSAAFSPDGRRLLTATLDGIVALSTVAITVPAGETLDVAADLAELAGGLRVSDLGTLEPVPGDAWRRSWLRVRGRPDAAPMTRDALVGPFVGPPAPHAATRQ